MIIAGFSITMAGCVLMCAWVIYLLVGDNRKTAQATIYIFAMALCLLVGLASESVVITGIIPWVITGVMFMVLHGAKPKKSLFVQMGKDWDDSLDEYDISNKRVPTDSTPV